MGGVHPILFQWGPLTLRWYGLMVALGFLAAHSFFRHRAPRAGLDENTASNLLFLLFVSGLVGARIYYVVWFWQTDFASNLWEILMIQHGGLVFYGGLFGGLTALVLWSRATGRALAPVADALAPPLALAQAFGRMGCFMNGCCHGSPCDLPWAVCPQAPLEVAGIPIHPTQLYELFGLLIIVIALLVIERLRRRPGQVVLSYVLLYSMLRFVVEFFRGDVPHAILGRFTLAQAVCAGLFIIAWIALSRLAWRAARARQMSARGN